MIVTRRFIVQVWKNCTDRYIAENIPSQLHNNIPSFSLHVSVYLQVYLASHSVFLFFTQDPLEIFELMAKRLKFGAREIMARLPGAKWKFTTRVTPLIGRLAARFSKPRDFWVSYHVWQRNWKRCLLLLVILHMRTVQSTQREN